MFFFSKVLSFPYNQDLCWIEQTPYLLVFNKTYYISMNGKEVFTIYSERLCINSWKQVLAISSQSILPYASCFFNYTSLIRDGNEILMPT